MELRPLADIDLECHLLGNIDGSDIGSEHHLAVDNNLLHIDLQDVDFDLQDIDFDLQGTDPGTDCTGFRKQTVVVHQG